MYKRMKETFLSYFRLFSYSLIFIFASSFIPPVYAADFTEDYDVSYAIAPTGVTTVTQNIILTNTTDTKYPKQFSIIIDTDKIKNVIAHDPGGVITPSFKQGDGKTEIALMFNTHVVGRGKPLAFTLRYENGSVTQKIGNIWEVSIPGVKDSESIRSYKVTFDAPTNFGPNAYLTPLPAKGRVWQKEQLLSGGITAAYGEAQFYRLTLLYHLTNSTFEKLNRQVALPPDTAYQKVAIESIDPLPSTIERTDDGNWIATFPVPQGSRLDVKAQMVIEVTVKPRDTFVRETPDLSRFILQDTYWETLDPTISALGKQYTSPKEIYEYVVKTLTYDYARVGAQLKRTGAVGALDNPQSALCTEFTDLFIAIARAAGIPARENVGFAYTTNPRLRPLSLIADVLHAWPEYYDHELELWTPVDPTWGNTTGGINYFDKLDFDHIVFAIHGSSSTNPLPAGFYRQSDDQGKDIQVALSEKTAIGAGKLLTSLAIPQFIIAGLPIHGVVRVQNTTGSSIEKTHMSIESKALHFTKNFETAAITPFASVSIPFEIQTKDFFAYSASDVLVNINDEIKRVYIPSYPMHWFLIPLAAIAVFIYLMRLVWLRRHKH